MKKQKKNRWKIPWLDFWIVRGAEIRSTDEIIATLEKDVIAGLRRDRIRGVIAEKLRHQTDEIIATLKKDVIAGLRRDKIHSLIATNLRHQFAVMTGKIPAPLCPICGEPKRAGGIQWIDHAECCKPKKKVTKNLATEGTENTEKI